MGSNRIWTVAVVLAVVAGAAGLGIGSLSRSSLSLSLETAELQTVPVAFEVHVAGWVANPGVVSVPDGAIVATAIDLAGGLKTGADSAAINLAAPLSPGDQIVVPGPQNQSGESSDGIVSLNQATAADLETLPGVGPVLAKRIVDHRLANGRFESVEDLLEVPGIGEAKLASLRDLVRP